MTPRASAGWLDVVVGEQYGNYVLVRTVNGAGAIQYLRTALPGGGFTKAIKAGDINGDGWPDIVTGETQDGAVRPEMLRTCARRDPQVV